MSHRRKPLASGVGRGRCSQRETDDPARGWCAVRVIDREDHREEEHFSEGEPDLEAPEELAVLELDDETQLEEDLDSRADLEDEVDEDILEDSLEHLVHDADGTPASGGPDADGDDDDALVNEGPPPNRVVIDLLADDVDLEDEEIEDLEDREESLDRILRQKLAGDEDGTTEGDGPVEVRRADGHVGHGSGEFVCRSCFLVRSRSLLVDGSGWRCRDCLG